MAPFTVPPEVAYRIARSAPDRRTLVTLTRTSRTLQEAAERLLRELAEPSNIEVGDITHLITSKVYLARVLRRRSKVRAAKRQ